MSCTQRLDTLRRAVAVITRCNTQSCLCTPADCTLHLNSPTLHVIRDLTPSTAICKRSTQAVNQSINDVYSRWGQLAQSAPLSDIHLLQTSVPIRVPTLILLIAFVCVPRLAFTLTLCSACAVHTARVRLENVSLIAGQSKVFYVIKRWGKASQQAMSDAASRVRFLKKVSLLMVLHVSMPKMM